MAAAIQSKIDQALLKAHGLHTGVYRRVADKLGIDASLCVPGCDWQTRRAKDSLRRLGRASQDTMHIKLNSLTLFQGMRQTQMGTFRNLAPQDLAPWQLISATSTINS